MESTSQAATVILGIPFFRGSTAEAVSVSMNGGLIVFPAAPALKDIVSDAEYRQALLRARLVAADSALMVLYWRIARWASVSRISGLRYLRELLACDAMRQPGSALWVMASEDDAQRNVEWLRVHGIDLRPDDVYVAPMYGATVSDEKLLRRLEAQRPAHVLLTVGGGKQEKLGNYLQQRLTYRPALHCVGAAIAFLSGSQVRIPVWADRLYLGWLFRIAAEPRRFGRRYWEALALVRLLWTYGARLPPLRADATASFAAKQGSQK